MGADNIVGVKGRGIGYPSPPPNIPGPEGPILSISPSGKLSDTVEWISLWLQPLALGCIKMSILAFYGRIFDVHKKGIFHTGLGILIGFMAVWTVAFFFGLFFMCGTTFRYLWGPYINLRTKCSNGHALWIDEAFSISDFCLDVLIFFLPLPKIWSLQRTLKRRLLITFIFLVGALAIVGSIIRMAIFIQVLNGIESSLVSQDGQLLVTKFLFWSMFEAGLAIIVICLPTINFLFARLDAVTWLHSIRSMLSLNSVHSRSGDSSNASHAYHRTRDPSLSADNTSTSSQLKIIPALNKVGRYETRRYGVETYIMQDLENPAVPNYSQTKVQNDVHYGSTMIVR
ncbi:MAG: hypothetical protein M1822_004483 [Bathelium mastoideum]|nr:MAG: hypothetical protein M1822_004483 [Bathelium mastoideum]